MPDLARARELLLGADEHVAPLDAGRLDRAVGRTARVVHQHHRLGRAGDPAAGDQDRLERRGLALAVGVRVAMPAVRGVAADAAAAADPRDALVVLVDVVRVVRVAVVAPDVDRLVGHLGPGRVREVGDPDRPAVADEAGERVRRRRGRAQDRPEPELIAAPRRAAGPDVLAVLDAARRVAGRQLDEVADLLEVRRVGVGDDVEPALAGRVRGAPAGRARAQRAMSVWRGSSAPMISLRFVSSSMSSFCQ